MTDESTRLSRTRIDKAGDSMRRARLGETVCATEVAEAFDVLRRFRREWTEKPRPLSGVERDVRTLVRRYIDWQVVSRRLKRETRIVDKLARYPRMRLSQMDDIGGCRVVTGNLEDLHVLRTRMCETWGDAIRREWDYIERPKADGYRAIHLVVSRADHLVEVQIRTFRQTLWAGLVEAIEYRSGTTQRGGTGSPELEQAFRDVAEYFSYTDRGELRPPELEARFLRSAPIVIRSSRLELPT